MFSQFNDRVSSLEEQIFQLEEIVARLKEQNDRLEKENTDLKPTLPNTHGNVLHLFSFQTPIIYRPFYK